MITSMQNKTVKELLKLKQKKYRKDYYLVETNHLVEEAIKAKQTDLIISTEPVDLGVENLVVSKEIMEKANGGLKLNPDEQRRFLGTFEERVLGFADIETTNDDKFKNGFPTILNCLKENTEPLFVKISPQVVFEKQVFYLKQAKDANCQATIVSEDHNSSPFGMVIHSDSPIQTQEKDLKKAFSEFLQDKEPKAPTSLWKKWFG